MTSFRPIKYIIIDKLTLFMTSHSLEDSAKFDPGFTSLDFATIIFTGLGCQPCVQPLYLCPSVTGWPSYTPKHRVPFPSPFKALRATVEVL
jgi:hypothetical protein